MTLVQDVSQRFGAHARSPVAAGAAGKVVEVVTQLLLVTSVPRLLGPVDYGRFVLALSIVMVLSSSLSLGGPALMSRFVPAVEPSKRDAVARALFVRVARWRALQVAVLTVVAIALVAADPDRFPPLTTFMVLLALALSAAATLAFQVALGFGQAGVFSFRFPIQNAILIVGALALGALAGADGAVAAIPIAMAGALAFGAATVTRRLRAAAPDAGLPHGAVRFAALQALAGFFGQFTRRAGIPAVALLGASKVETGFAGLAVSAALAATLAISQLFSVQLPSLVANAGGDFSGAEARARRLALRVEVVALPVALLGAALASPLVPVLVGEEYRGAGDAVGIALAMLPLAPISALAAQTAVLRLRSGVRAWGAAVGAAVFVVTAVVGVPLWGGAVAASAALVAGTAAPIVFTAFFFPRVLTRPLLALAFGGAALVMAVALVA